MKPLITLLQNLILSRKGKPFSSGFTLLELLIATVMSSIVISSLLYFMIDIVRTNAAETARKDTLQDMRRALEFITDDLKEATYVYTGDQLEDRDINADANDGILDILDIDDELKPILVFWKLEDVPYTEGDSLPDDCSAEEVQANEQVCEELLISQRTYTLVAYVQDNNPSDKWGGKSIIRRYQLRKYFNSDTKPFNTLEQRPGYIDPVKESSFANWPYDDGNLPSDYTNPTIDRSHTKNPPLVDFVDFPDENEDEDDDDDDFLREDVSCLDGYNRTPQDQAEDETDPSRSSSFYACVEEADTEDEDDIAIPANNATVIVNLRGNPDGRVSFDLSDSSPLPTLNSSVVLRGSNR